MALLARAEIPFPSNGGNSSETIINGQHYNLTLLNHYNFTLFDNYTISNGSWCYLTLPSVTSMPTLFANGSIVNGTSCYIPYYAIQARGAAGLAVGVLYAMSIMLTLVCLNKHGQLYLPAEKRFRPIGRRWQWYWMLYVAACGAISNISAIDVDRDYLPSSGIMIQNVFWYLMFPGLLATVWEGVRHWGSWQERQLYDQDPFSLPQDGRRWHFEFWMPLIFYLFAWMNFFMNIPRNWLGFQAQADQWQISNIAIPAGTDVRFKAGAILAFLAWLTIPIHMGHSIYYYRLRPVGRPRNLWLALRAMHWRFWFTIPLLLVAVGYAEAQGWLWAINIGNQSGNVGLIYGLGSGPALLILYINIIAGLTDPNEDLALIKQRAERGRAIDEELGLNKTPRKPWWWRRVAGDIGMSNDAQLRALAAEAGMAMGRPAREDTGDIPLTGLDGSHGPPLPPYTDTPAVADEAPPSFSQAIYDGAATPASEQTLLFAGEAGQLERGQSTSGSSTASNITQVPPQRVRSMLDI